jgi:hypothetical protein
MKQTSISLAQFDPWQGSAPARTPNDEPQTPPVDWHRLSDGSRARLGGALFYIASANDSVDVDVLTARARQVVRARHDRTEGATDPPRFPLDSLYVTDAEERQQWRQLEAELAPLGAALLRAALLKLRAAGGLEATLRARIEGDTTRLAELARLLRGEQPAVDEVEAR